MSLVSDDLVEDEENVRRDDEEVATSAPADGGNTTIADSEDDKEDEKTEANTTNVEEEPAKEADHQAEEEASPEKQDTSIIIDDEETTFQDYQYQQPQQPQQLLLDDETDDFINPSQIVRNNNINVAAESQVIVLEDFDFMGASLIPEMIDSLRQQDPRIARQQQPPHTSFIRNIVNNENDSMPSTNESVIITSNTSRRVLGERSNNVETFHDVQIAMRVTSPKQQQQQTNRNQVEE